MYKCHVRIERSLEHCPLQATYFKRVSCKSHTYDLVRTGALTKLLTRFQVKHHAPGSTVFQHVTLKNWEWPGDKHLTVQIFVEGNKSELQLS